MACAASPEGACSAAAPPIDWISTSTRGAPAHRVTAPRVLADPRGISPTLPLSPHARNTRSKIDVPLWGGPEGPAGLLCAVFQKAPLDSCALCGIYCSENRRKYKRLNGETKKELHDSWQYLPYERAWSEPVLKHNALLHGKRMFAGEDICIRCIDENNFAKPGTSCSDVAVSDTLADLLARERTTVMHECAAEM